MSVSIRNIYYLLCYAWRHFEAQPFAPVGTVQANRAEDFFGHVLRTGVGSLLRAGLDHGYRPQKDDGRQLRGKLLISETLQRVLLQQGRVACETDELTVDVPHNRVIKAALTAILDVPTLDRGLRSDLHKLLFRFTEVADCELSPALFRRVQLHRNIVRYAFLLDVARLICDSHIPDPAGGRRRFTSFLTSDQQMGLVFQAFVFNFLAREQTNFVANAAKVKWDVADSDLSAHAWLPEMQTDIFLTNARQRVIIETKYTSAPFQQRGEGSKKLQSAHLYQLMSYVLQSAAKTGPKPVGVLLYAGAGVGEPVTMTISGFPILVRNLDLDKDWDQIHKDLLGLASELSSIG